MVETRKTAFLVSRPRGGFAYNCELAVALTCQSIKATADSSEKSYL